MYVFLRGLCIFVCVLSVIWLCMCVFLAGCCCMLLYVSVALFISTEVNIKVNYSIIFRTHYHTLKNGKKRKNKTMANSV